MIRVVLPFHLRTLARVDDEVQLDVPPPVTIRAALDALEARFPAMRGTIRDHGTLKRGIAVFESIEDGAEGDGAGDFQGYFVADQREVAQVVG